MIFSRRPGARFNRGRIATGGGGAPAYAPATDTALRFWLDMQDAASYTDAAGVCSAFTNKATGTSWTQGTAGNRAAIELTGLNNLPCLHPDGGDHYLNAEATLLALFNGNNDPFHFAAVCSLDSGDALTCLFGVGNSGASTGYRGFGQITTGTPGRYFAFSNDGASNNIEAAPVDVNDRGNTFVWPVILEWWSTDGTDLHCAVDGVEIALTDSTPNWTAITVNRCSLFSRPRSANDLGFDGRLGEMLIATSYDSRRYGYLKARWGFEIPETTWEGDSLTKGFGTVSTLTLPDRITLLDGIGKKWDVATNGQEVTANMVPDAALQVDGKFRTGAKNVAILWGGNNDIRFTAQTSAQIYASITTWVQARKAAGFRVIVCTVTHRATATLAGGGVALYNSVCDALNALIMANTAGADLAFDIQGYLTAAGATADLAPNTYYSDDAHITDACYDLFVADLQAATRTQVAA